MDSRCNTCGNASSYNFCWHHSGRRLCVMARNDSADYTWNQGGHLHSPLCRFCENRPAVITCADHHRVMCDHCFQQYGWECVMSNHRVLVIPFSSHVTCCNDPSEVVFPQGVRPPIYRPPPPRPPQPRPPQHQHGMNLQLAGPSRGPSGGPPRGGSSGGTRRRSEGTQYKKNEHQGALPLSPFLAMTQQATRHYTRVYVGGLPATANEQSVATFFSQAMSAIGGNTAGPGDAVVNVYMNEEKKFAFLQMRSVEEASNAMALDGILLEGAPVMVKRPTGYNPSLASALGPSQPNPNLNLAAVEFSSERVLVGGLPYYLKEDQIRELLESLGPLRGLQIVKDMQTRSFSGYAFCVYEDPSVTDIACAALNGIKMGNNTLTVRRAVQGAVQHKPEQEDILLDAKQQIALQRLMLQPGGTPTKIVCLTQVVSADDLGNDEEYEDMMEDMRQEGGKFGNLVKVVIPRPDPDHVQTPAGVGKVFLEYGDVDGAEKAISGMNGRKFGGNQVVAVYYPENKYAQRDYQGC